MTAYHLTILPVDRGLKKPLSTSNDNIVKALILIYPGWLKYVKVKLDLRGGLSILIFRNLWFDEEGSPKEGHGEVVWLEVPSPISEFSVMVDLNRFLSLNKQQADPIRRIA
jgi:hypothetical protein